MPFYTYICKEHGKFELMHSMDETKLDHPCPECGEVMKRKFMPLRINFKQPIAGHGLEVYTNERDAEEQLFHSIEEEG